MYSGGLFDDSCHAAGVGLALGLHVRAVLLCGIITVRLLDEDRYLSKNLPDKAGLPHQGWLPA
jgi:hypothetical protein